MFSKIYPRVLRWSRHPRAFWCLGAVSFAESSFFLVPPDVLLAPMVLGRPHRAWPLATWTTATSVLGGVFGFALGAFAIQSLQPVLVTHGYWDPYLLARQWFTTWGFWAVLIAGFSPIPYKVFALAAGAAAMPLTAFILASLVGRGGRFFLVAGLIAWGGEPMERGLRTHIDRLGWGSVGAAAAVYLVMKIG